jgi:hypothetical protein
MYFKLFVPCILSTYEMKNQQMSLFQFYSYIDGSLHVTTLTYFIVFLQLLKHSFNKTIYRPEHDDTGHRETAKAHNIIVNKERNL